MVTVVSAYNDPKVVFWATGDTPPTGMPNGSIGFEMDASGNTMTAALLIAKAISRRARYVMEFSATDWVTGTTYDTLAVSKTDHGRGANPVTEVYFLSGTSYVKQTGTPQDALTVSMDTSGNITLSVETGKGFDGKLVVL